MIESIKRTSFWLASQKDILFDGFYFLSHIKSDLVLFNSYKEIQEALASGKTTCKDLVSHYLGKIEAQKDLNAFLEVYTDEALAKAEEVDQKIKDGKAGKLAGMVVGLKDVIAHENHGLQASSKILVFRPLGTCVRPDRTF